MKRVLLILLLAALLVTACGGGGSSDSGYDKATLRAGKQTFDSICSACHGPDARGLPDLGVDLIASEFVGSSTNDELIDFVKIGRPVFDPANTSGVEMPPRAGDPTLTDEEILNTIIYLRSLRGE